MMCYRRSFLLLPLLLGALFFHQSFPIYAQRPSPDRTPHTALQQSQDDARLFALIQNKQGALDFNHADAVTVQAVRKALVMGADINARDSLVAGGYTALTYFTEYSDNLPVIRYLLSHGADVNMKAGDGTAALIAAASGGHADVVQLLLAHRANINVRDRQGATALMRAAHTNMVKLLLAHGADVKARDSDGTTALMLAAYQGSVESVKMLLAHGAEINVRDKYGNTALGWATRGGPPGLNQGRPVIMTILKAAGAK